MLLAMKEVGGYNRSRQCTCLALWDWTVISVTVPIRKCSLYECDSGKARCSNKRMAHRFTAQMLGTAPTLQSLHASGTVASDGVFEQAPRMAAKHFRKCNSSASATVPQVQQFSSCTVLERETYARSVSPSH